MPCSTRSARTRCECTNPASPTIAPLVGSTIHLKPLLRVLFLRAPSCVLRGSLLPGDDRMTKDSIHEGRTKGHAERVDARRANHRYDVCGSDSPRCPGSSGGTVLISGRSKPTHRRLCFSALPVDLCRFFNWHRSPRALRSAPRTLQNTKTSPWEAGTFSSFKRSVAAATSSPSSFHAAA